MNHCAIYLKLTSYCKSTILQFREKTDTLPSTIIKRNLIKIKKKVNDHYP